MSSTGHDRLAAYLAGPSGFATLVHLEEVDSTNDEVARRVRDGGPAGLVVVADRQTAGRGRSGAEWVDVDGGNLSVSVATGVPGDAATLVPLATGLAVSDALKRRGHRAMLKWPNDVLVPVDDGELVKVAGILVDAHDLRASGGPAFLVIGIGVDIDWRGVDRSGDAAAWTSLAEVEGDDVDRWEVLHDVLRALEAWLLDVPQDPHRLLAAYKVRCATLGQQVHVETPRGAVEGRAVDIDPTGGLVVDTATGRQVLMAGQVQHVRPA